MRPRLVGVLGLQLLFLPTGAAGLFAFELALASFAARPPSGLAGSAYGVMQCTLGPPCHGTQDKYHKFTSHKKTIPHWLGCKLGKLWPSANYLSLPARNQRRRILIQLKPPAVCSSVLPVILEVFRQAIDEPASYPAKDARKNRMNY